MSKNRAVEDARPFTMDWTGVTKSWEGLLLGVNIGSILATDARAVPTIGPQARPASVPVKKKKKRSSETATNAKLPKDLHPASHELLRAPAESRRNSGRLPTVPKVDQVPGYGPNDGAAQQSANRSTSHTADVTGLEV